MNEMARDLGHFLKRIDNPESGDCRCCKDSVARNPAYQCLDCKFVIHTSCLEAIQKKEKEVQHDFGEGHHFFETKMTVMKLHDDGENKVVCSMCKEIEPHLSGKDAPIIYKCFIPNCSYFIHESCVKARDQIMGYYWLFLKPPPEIQHSCDACGKHLSGRFFYECSQCEYEIDIKCSYGMNVSPDKCSPHTFIVTGSRIEFTCQVCGEKRSDMGFVCSNCQFLIHTKCARFPPIIKVRGHDNSLHIVPPLSLQKYQGSHTCQVCTENVNTDYGAYCCDQPCEFIAHLWCAYFEDESGTSGSASYRNLLVEEENKELIRDKLHSSLHQDELNLLKEEPKDKSCAGCMRHIFLPQFYGCGKPRFFVHIKCAQVPKEINRRGIHKHQLRLVETQNRFWCWECDCVRNGFRYVCDECGWYRLDIQCAVIPEAFNHKLHRHRLYRGNSGEASCRACGEYRYWVRSFKCKTCNFYLCIICVTLPLVARHKYDKHLLSITNKVEDNPQECYCQICEKKLDINYWFYYCKDCDFIGHSKCVL